MPFLNGLDFIRGQIQKGCKVKSWALMSGDWTHANLDSAQNLGCRIFTKPFDILKIVRWIKECQKRMDSYRELSDGFRKKEVYSDTAKYNLNLV